MNFSFSTQIHQLVIRSQCEVTLRQLEALITEQDIQESGFIWITEKFSISPKWDLAFWLKRCERSVQAFLYDVDQDERENLPLFYSSEDVFPTRENILQFLPLTCRGTKTAFFLDRDGIINVDHAYVYKIEDTQFLPGIVEFIQYLQSSYDYVIVLTNQSGIGRGYYTEDDVLNLHQYMSEDLEKSEARIDAWYYCPFHPKGEVKKYHRLSYLRKPFAGMALRAAADYDLDLSRCAMVGDKVSDYLADLKLETYLIRGNYPLETDLPKFDSLEDLELFLKSKK